MKSFFLFTDGSVNPAYKIGFGSYLLIDDILIDELNIEKIKSNIQSRKFEDTTSTKLEIETLLWALKETINFISNKYDDDFKIIIYTDSQNIKSLPERRKSLEKQNFKNKSGNKELNNADLYKQFYKITDKINFKIVKLTGHSKSKQKDKIDRIFTYVDRNSRKVLREFIKKHKK